MERLVSFKPSYPIRTKHVYGVNCREVGSRASSPSRGVDYTSRSCHKPVYLDVVVIATQIPVDSVEKALYSNFQSQFYEDMPMVEG